MAAAANNKGKTAGKGRTSSSKNGRTSAKGGAKSRESEAARQKRRAWSFILFFLGILEVMITFIRGEGLWTSLFLLNRGLFGISSFIMGPMIIYVALQIASDRSHNAVVARVVQGICLMLLLCATMQILVNGSIAKGGFSEKVRTLYSQGAKLRGGGLIGALLGYPLLAAFKKVGSAIIIILLDLTFILLLTNLTLPDIFKALSKPFVGGYKAVSEDMVERGVRQQEKAAAKQDEPPKTRDRLKDKKARVDLSKFVQDDLPEQENTDKRGAEKRREPVFPFTEGVDTPKNTQRTTIPEFIRSRFNGGSQTDDHDNYDDYDEEEYDWDDVANKPNPVPDDTPDIFLAPESRRSFSDMEKLNSAAKEQTNNAAAEDKELSQVISRAVTREQEKEKERQKEKQRQKKEPPLELFIDKDGQTSLTRQNGSVAVYTYPPIDLLKYSDNSAAPSDAKKEIEEKSRKLVETLETFGVKTRIIGIHRGPAVTRYELQPAAGVKVKQITNLSDDIALNLAANGVRIEAPIPGKAAIGIEIPNIHRDNVSLRELIDSDEYRNAKGKLSFAVGKDIEGKIVVGDISTMPHMLIAGTTGSGKSVFTNSIILNILFHAAPDEVKLILIDPKKVEFPVYNGIPHLLIPVVTDPLKAAGALGWAVNEMMRRYKLFEANGTKNLEDYNQFVEEDGDPERVKLPQIVIVIDEFADLMLAAKSEVEESVMRLAQLARAAGMHMLIATQSPRVDVITGLIKANIPSRTALSVSNNQDSRVILDEIGAEKLLGKGDLLYKPVGYPKPVRIQSGFASTSEIRSVVKFLKNEQETEYSEEIIHEVERNIPQPKSKGGEDDFSINSDDDLTTQAITLIVESGNASTAFLQRRLKLGFPRAARIMDEIEEMGIIGPQEGAKPRAINITKEEWYERQGRS